MNGKVLSAVMGMDLKPQPKLLLLAMLSEVKYKAWSRKPSTVLVSASRKTLQGKSIANNEAYKTALDALLERKIVSRPKCEGHASKTSRTNLFVHMREILGLNKNPI